jgi:hypothetical protein
MCKLYQKELDDPWLDDMNPILKHMYYECFMADLEDKHKFERTYSILTGSFSNVEMAKKMYDDDSGSDYESTEEDLNETMKWVQESQEALSKPKRRRRRVVNGHND